MPHNLGGMEKIFYFKEGGEQTNIISLRGILALFPSLQGCFGVQGIPAKFLTKLNTFMNGLIKELFTPDS